MFKKKKIPLLWVVQRGHAHIQMGSLPAEVSMFNKEETTQ